MATHKGDEKRPSPPEATGVVFDIKRYSIHDGPGIRTTVFFKGCPLSCWWCHNPEGRSPKPELTFFQERCRRCGDCIALCPHGAITKTEDGVHTSFSVCRACGTCVEACPGGARELAGRWMGVADVVDEVEKDVIFYDQSGGGVTFSGGEPLTQPRFLEALVEACAERRIHTVVDTCGLGDKGVMLHLSEKVDMFLFDFKMFDRVKHEKYVGIPNDVILENLEALARASKPIIVRFPVVPGINDGVEDIRQMAAFLSRLGLLHIDLLPYHRLGAQKYRRMQLEYRLEGLEPPSDSAVRDIARRLEQEGFTVGIGG